MLRSAAWAALVPLLACDAGAVREPSSIPLVENVAPRWAAAAAWRLAAEPALSVGEAEGSPEYLLSNVAGAAHLPGGGIVIASRGTQELRFYSARGEHVATAGRPGEGPGEFRWLDRVGVLGDSVLAWDGAARRVSVFDTAGALLRSLRIEGMEEPFPEALGSMGGTLVLLPRVMPRGERSAGEHADSSVLLLVSIDDGQVRGTLGPYHRSERHLTRVGRFSLTGRVVFGREGLTAVHGRGFYTATTDRFEVTAHAPDGTPVRRVRRPHRAVRPTRADVDAARAGVEEDYEEVVRTHPQMRQVRQRLLEELPARSTLPALTALVASADGTLWVRGYAPPDAETAAWSVFDPEGRWLGTVEVPAALEVLEIGPDWLLGRTVDDDGVERVVLHRIVRPEAG